MKERIPKCRSFFPPMILLYMWCSHETHANSGSIIYKQEISHYTLPAITHRLFWSPRVPARLPIPPGRRKDVPLHTFLYSFTPSTSTARSTFTTLFRDGVSRRVLVVFSRSTQPFHPRVR